MNEVLFDAVLTVSIGAIALMTMCVVALTIFVIWDLVKKGD
jgi:hypothetical protein